MKELLLKALAELKLQIMQTNVLLTILVINSYPPDQREAMAIDLATTLEQLEKEFDSTK